MQRERIVQNGSMDTHRRAEENKREVNGYATCVALSKIIYSSTHIFSPPPPPLSYVSFLSVLLLTHLHICTSFHPHPSRLPFSSATSIFQSFIFHTLHTQSSPHTCDSFPSSPPTSSPLVLCVSLVSLSLLSPIVFIGFSSLKGTYYENDTFPGIWGVVLGLPHAYKR